MTKNELLDMGLDRLKGLISKNIHIARTYNIDTAPQELHIELTHRCNSRCVMCDLWPQGLKSEDKELGLGEIERLIKESKYLKDIKMVILSGGEPFLREDFTDICGLFSRYLPLATLNILTNGLDTDFILDKVGSVIRGFLSKNLMIGSSIDGIGEAHDRIRGVKGSFERMKETVELIKRINGIEYCLNFTIAPQNYNQLIPCYRFSKDMGARFSAQFVVKKEVKYDFSWEASQLNEIEVMVRDIIIDLVEGRSIEEIVENPLANLGFVSQVYYWLNLVEYEKTPRRILPYCPAGRRFAMFTPYGDLFFCPLLKHRIVGNIRDASFDELWVSKEASDVCDFISSGRCHCWLVCIVAPVLGDMMLKNNETQE